MRCIVAIIQFLSSNAQDFIEETTTTTKPANTSSFLSSNAQDFIEEGPYNTWPTSPSNS